ncbi:MAG TPA: ABC transporter permease [Bryobacteraceae bacterium]|jgi:ABC-type polysaccharide/polyol phosphate export permease
MWRGDYLYLIQNLVVKDFKIRYRNMSLGVLWSLLNPLVMMAVYYFVFTKIFKQPIPQFPLFLLCGLVPFNFFTVAWATGTTSIVDNAGLIKRVPVPREIIPITTVLSCCIHLLVQVALLLSVATIYGKGFNVHWFWLPVVWALELVFVCGLALLTSAINVFIRDTRYVVESATLVLLFLVPVFYDFSIIPKEYEQIYDLNPVAATVISLRKIVYEAKPPVPGTLWRLVGVSLTVFLIGLLFFRRVKPMFYEHI